MGGGGDFRERIKSDMKNLTSRTPARGKQDKKKQEKREK